MTSLLRVRSCVLGRNLLNNNNKHSIISLFRPVSLKPQPYSAIVSEENHDERNMELKRPLSPHLSVYSLQLTSTLSISHRFTGMALAGYTVLFGLGAVVLPDSIPHYIEALSAQHIGAFSVLTGKFILSFPLTYHFWNGIRHLFWDTGRFLTISEVYTTGYIMLILAAVSAGAMCFL